MRLIPVLMFIVGMLLIYSARTDKDPRTIVFEALGRKSPYPDFAPVGNGQTVGQFVTPSNAGANAASPGVKVTTV